MKYNPLFTLIYSITLLTVTATTQATDIETNPVSKPSTILANIVAGNQRSNENKSRDIHRHPLQTLTFFGTEADMTVVEIWPGGGWYTEILAPLLSEKGKLYATHFSADAKVPYFRKSLKDFQTKLTNNTDTYGNVTLTILQPPAQLEIAPAGSADQVLTFRNVHNWMRNDQAPTVFKAMYKALKPGGILGVVEHRGLANQAQDPKAESGYVTETHVILLAQQAGFKLADKAEINANPKDGTLHPKGVWTLPPRLKLGDNDQERYLAIGESDRMTLKFIKP